MKITRSNYEIYIIDYLDGRLNPVESAELLWFISQNPDLEEEFNSFINLKIPLQNLQTDSFQNLKKEFSDIAKITESNFEEFCIGYHEKDLDDNSIKKLFEYLKKNPEKKKDFEIYQKINLKADKQIVYSDKNLLKKHKPLIVRYLKPLIYSGIAAAILIAVLLILTPEKIKNKAIPVAETNSVQPEKNINNIADNTVNINPEEIKPLVKKIITKKVKVPITYSASNYTDIKETKRQIEQLPEPISRIEIHQLKSLSTSSELKPEITKLPYTALKESKETEEKSFAVQFAERVMVNENINMWTLAEASVKGLNYLTESDLHLDRKLKDNGKMSSISVESETFRFSAPLKK